MSGLLLGVDVGTSNTKGVLARPDGAVLASAERPHDLSLPRPGWAEHDADWSTIAATVEPKEENTEVYDELYRIYRELYLATREQMHNLADMQK